MSDRRFYQVLPADEPDLWRLYFGRCTDPKLVDADQFFETVQAAKLYCINKYNEIPVRMVDRTERLFDDRQKLHRVLAVIEARNRAHSRIVAVGAKHYLIRYSKYGMDTPVKYVVRGDMVVARKDSELLT